MRRLTNLLKRMFWMIHREGLFRVLFITGALAVIGSIGFHIFEKKGHFTDALWWAVVTMSTVGYGDISPSTTGGRVVAIGLMVVGIGVIGILTATVASIFVENRFLEHRGMKEIHVRDHYIICGWNFRGHRIVEALRSDSRVGKAPIVLIAEIPQKPMDDPHLLFIHGEVTPDNLTRACIETARVVLVLSDDGLDAFARDAKTVLTTLTIETLNPDVYTCVELMDEKHVPHCQRARADEIIVMGEISTNLLVQAALNPGITRMISELVSHRYTQELYKIPLPADLAGQSFYQVMCELKQRHGILCIGIGDASGRKFVANPDIDYTMAQEDHLIVIASSRPAIG